MSNFAPRVASALCLSIVLALAGGCATDKQIISQANNAHSQLDPAVITDAAVAEYVQSVGDRVVDAARELSAQGYGPKAHKSGETEWMFQDIRFHLVNSDTLNAFTTGGQHIYMYNELFQSCQNEDEFAAVVAHEFAHIYGRHVQKGTDRQYGLLGAAAVAGAAGYALGDGESRATYAAAGAGGAMALGQFANMGFTRGDEDEADKVGFAFYTHAGWDPTRFAGFFQYMIDKGYDTTPEMMSDHPSLKNRVANAERRANELPADAEQWRRPDIAGEERFRQLQRRAVKAGQTMPNDKTLAAAKLMLSAFPSCVTPEDTKDQKQAQATLADYAQRAEPPKK